MKKIILISMLGLVFTKGHSQIKTDAGTFTKPVKGTIAAEITFAPNLGGTGMFSLPALNAKAEILGVKARSFVSADKAYRAVGNLSIKNSGKKDAPTEFIIGLGAGIENHMTGAERLSTYWGYEANFGFWSKEDKSTIFGLGVNAFTGFDYYIMPKIYLGVEVAYGFALTNTKPETGDAITSFELAPGVTPFMRMGWLF